jgi:predicted Ser/Thr protein kinase
MADISIENQAGSGLSPNGCLHITFRDYLERLLADRAIAEKAAHESILALLDSRLQSMDVATKLALATNNERLNSMNEWRGQSKDREQQFVTRMELGSWKERVDQDIRTLNDFRSQQQGKASQASVMIALAISVSGVVLSVVSLVIKLMGR